MRTGQSFVTLQNFGREPIRQRVLRERVSVVRWHAVWRMRIPEVDVKEPGIGRTAKGKPIIHCEPDVVRGFHPALPCIVNFVETGVNPVRTVALAEGRNHTGKRGMESAHDVWLAVDDWLALRGATDS